MKVQEVTSCLEAAQGYFQSALGESVILLPGTIEFQSLLFSELTGITTVKGWTTGFFYLSSSRDFFADFWKTKDQTGDPLPAVPDAFVEQVLRQLGARITQSIPTLTLESPRVFGKIPEDMIELPSATYCAHLEWKEHLAYFAIGFNELANP